jgi:hypothetical protein
MRYGLQCQVPLPWDAPQTEGKGVRLSVGSATVGKTAIDVGLSGSPVLDFATSTVLTVVYANDAVDNSMSAGALRRRITELDLLHSDLLSGNYQLGVEPHERWQAAQPLGSAPYGVAQAPATSRSPIPWYVSGVVPATAACPGNRPGAVAPPDLPYAWFESLADHGCDPESLLLAIDRLSAAKLTWVDAEDAVQAAFSHAWMHWHARWEPLEAPARPHLPQFDLVRLARLCAGGPGALAPEQPAYSYVSEIRQALSPALQEDLLRLVKGVRAALRLTLVRVLNALSHRPDALSLVLALLGTSRRFGHRGDPEHNGLPALTPKPVVIGGPPVACS